MYQCSFLCSKLKHPRFENNPTFFTAKRLKKLEKKAAEVAEIAHCLQTKHTEFAEKKAVEEWNRLGEDQKVWEKEIFGGEKSDIQMKKFQVNLS